MAKDEDRENHCFGQDVRVGSGCKYPVAVTVGREWIECGASEDFQHCGYCGRRHREGSCSRGHSRAGSGWAAFRFPIELARVRLELRTLRKDRKHEAAGWAATIAALRGYFPGCGWTPKRSRSCLLVGAFNPHSQGLSPVRQLTAGASFRGDRNSAKELEAWPDRLLHRARKQRRGIFKYWRAAL